MAPLDFVAALCDTMPGMVMVDRAYVEFADDSFGGNYGAKTLLPSIPNLNDSAYCPRRSAPAAARLGYVRGARVIDVFAAIRQIFSGQCWQAKRQRFCLRCVPAMRTRRWCWSVFYPKREARVIISRSAVEAAWPKRRTLLTDAHAACHAAQRLRDEYSILVRDFSYAPGLADCLALLWSTRKKTMVWLRLPRW